MSPFSTLKSWGSSSMLSLRRILPMGVMRGSFHQLLPLEPADPNAGHAVGQIEIARFQGLSEFEIFPCGHQAMRAGRANAQVVFFPGLLTAPYDYIDHIRKRSGV
jgi:hypothetical protein